ncbi:inactive phospholipase C-like protein 1 [Nothobranchius furzeri]|uniref:Phosphoinositide phospholipase C n=3 Tax=Nothobranchius TaxID=28779 RepID=A0A1A7ZMI1_NOTFU|nr:inactive phospholipase C-like protein 1 isoform X2 [Nothobranchius furzeri]KAF7216245.1 inactive phospholipase C-like protein 1 [Nothobranchius furzeri]
MIDCGELRLTTSHETLPLIEETEFLPNPFFGTHAQQKQTLSRSDPPSCLIRLHLACFEPRHSSVHPPISRTDMSERDGCGDGLSSDGAPDCIPPRAPRGRRSGVILPGQETDSILLENVKAAPRRSSIIKDPSAQKVGGGRKKTVSFSSMPSEKKVSSAADCLAFMQGGCELKKIRPNSRVYCRFYTLDTDLSCLHWEPSKKDADRARLDVFSIREVRTGKSTETFLHNGPLSDHLAEEAAFSIIHGDDYQSLDLVALSADVANIWVTGLRYLLAHPSIIGGAGGGVGGVGGGPGDGGGVTVEGSLGNKMRMEWLAAEFSQVDEDGYGIVSEDVAVTTVCKLCPGIKEAKVRLRFKEIQSCKEKLTSHVTREEFQEAFCELCTRPDVYFLLVQLSQDRECLDPQDLRLFLETEQGLSLATTEGCWELLKRYEPSAQGRERGLMGLDGFARYLQSSECQLLDPEHLGVCQDMNLPLSHYYISTSYRSYLLDDQVHGKADLGGLIRALQTGCRCLELGVTDGPEGEPLLGVDCGSEISHHHHHHHHAPVTIRSALEVVNKYAFLTSQYPLLLYLCQRCSPAQQRSMAHHLKKVFGSRLYTPDALPVSLGGRATTLPSPEQLKGRVLIVGKKLPPEQEGSDGEVSEEDEEIGGGGPLAGRRMTIPGEEELGMVLVVPPPSQPRKLQLHKELSDVVAIARTGSRSFYVQRGNCKQHQSPPSSPSSPSSPNPPELPYWTMCSLGEGEAGRLTSESPEDLVMFTKRTLTRVRPSSVRLDSSNPNPQGYWKGGVQLVALNQQTPGAMLDLHRGRFSQNGGCGYVLRPAVMRNEVSYFSAHTHGCVPGVPPQTLRIKVISAHNLPKPQGSGAKGEVIDPYVVLELHGVPADCAEQRTRTAAQNQDDPLFDETFEFQVNMPELALLRFVVLDDDYIGDDFIGQYSVAFECLQPGYRNVPLLGMAGDPLPHTSLFVHVAITNRRGGGKAQRRGLSVRRVGRRGREYVTLRHTGIKVLDEAFKQASGPLKEATDLREDAQSSTASFKDQCGLPSVAKLKQCIQSLATRLQSSDGAMGATMVLREGYPSLEPLVSLSEMTRKLLAAYDSMIASQKHLIENADGVQERIDQVHREGMDFHEDLSRLGEKEGLKGRKLNKAVESFTWNITVLKGQSDLLRGAKMDSLDALRQLALACEACGLTSSCNSSSSFSNAELHFSTSGRRSSTHNNNGRI